ncbi:MAG: hydroxyacid dehydrogenase [Thermoproteota archaeon]
MGLRVLVCDPIDREGLEALKAEGVDVVYEPEIDRKALKTRVEEFEGIVVRSRTKVDREIIDAARNLRVIGRVGVGLDNIDVEYAEVKGIKIVSSPDAPTTSVAELTVALMLSVLRSIPYVDAEMKKGNWPKGSILGFELSGKTVGVVGAAGRIGFEVAKILRNGFNVRVIGFDIVDLKEKAKLIGMEVAQTLDQLLSESDIVTLHIPYTAKTHHLIDRSRIQAMKDGAVLINTSRGDIIDGIAVLEALKRGKLSGVGLDVYHREPPIDGWERELIGLPDGRSVCTCHIGSQTLEAQRKASKTVFEEILKALKAG